MAKFNGKKNIVCQVIVAVAGENNAQNFIQLKPAQHRCHMAWEGEGEGGAERGEGRVEAGPEVATTLLYKFLSKD